MQCNAMYVRKSVRPYGMKSVSHFFLFFIFFFSQCTEVRQYVMEHECQWMDKFQLFFLSVKMNVTDGQTSFSFSSVSVQSHSQVSLSVRTEVPTKKKEKKICYGQKTETQIRSEVIHSIKLNVTDGNNSWMEIQ
jgi:hypothetical protein